MGLTTSQILATYGHLTNQNGRALYVNTKGASTNRFIPAASLNLPQAGSGVNPILYSFSLF